MNKSIIVFIIVIVSAIGIYAQTFVAKEDNRNQATFESNAPLEDIVGVSNNLEATAEISPSNLANVKGKVVVDLRELKTGIGLRDRHLRSEMWLNTDEYPYATFELKKITGAQLLSDNQPVEVKLHGIFSVHGVSKDIIADGELTYYKESEKTKARIKGNLLKVQAKFSIKLADYGVTIPDMVVGKVDDTIKVSTTFVATDSIN